MSAALFREMFERMVIRKDADLIERYYHPGFVMYSDGVSQGFAEFAASHRTVYATERPTRIEVVVIAAYRDGLIHRVWETTWPSWRSVAAFEGY